MKEQLLRAMHLELDRRKDYLSEKKIKTIYFGGGTPSVLEAEEIHAFLQKSREYFEVDAHAEITLEANPDDLSFGKISAFRDAGINRLSIGIQSFRQKDLEWMNRSHSAEQAIRSVRDAQDAGINNITIDLIYGIPGLTEEEWESNIRTAIELGVPHISAYCLTVEPGTALDHFVKKQKAAPVDEELASRHFLLLMKRLQENGYVPYEISNFGKEGFFSRHNTSYWNGTHYLGIGPSAHSYNGTTRSYNIANNARYIKQLQEGVEYSETEILTPENKFNEYIMTRLRTMWGIQESEISSQFGEKHLVHFRTEVLKWIHHGKIREKNQSFILTNEGRLLCDKIISDLFIS